MNYGRKVTGGKYHKFRKKKLRTKKGQERPVILGETKSKQLKIRGGNYRVILLKSNVANIIDSKGKAQKAEIINVEETPQNRFLARQNRLVKSAKIETSLGKARITNRPSREGQVNAILLKE